MTWRDLDRHHREMEQAVSQWQGDHDGLDSLSRSRANRIFPLGRSAAGGVYTAGDG